MVHTCIYGHMVVVTVFQPSGVSGNLSKLSRPGHLPPDWAVLNLEWTSLGPPTWLISDFAQIVLVWPNRPPNRLTKGHFHPGILKEVIGSWNYE